MRLFAIMLSMFPALLFAQSGYKKTTRTIRPGLTIVESNYIYQLKDPEMKVYLGPFVDGKPLYGLFDEKKGKLILEPRYFGYDMAWAGMVGRLIVWDTSFYYGIFDVDSEKWVVHPDRKFTSINRYSEGLAVVKVNKGKIGSSNYADDRSGCVDSTGRLVIPTDYYTLFDSKEGLLNFTKPNEKGYGYIDRNNKAVIPLSPSLQTPGFFKDGIAKVGHAINDQGKALYGFIDRTGKYIIKTEYTEVDDFFLGYAIVYLNKPSSYTFDENTRAGVINRKGQTVIPTQYKYVTMFDMKKKTFKVTTLDNKYGLTDSTGKFIIPATYKDMQPLIDGYFIATDGAGQTGIADASGKWANPPKAGMKIERLHRRKILMHDGRKISLFNNDMKPLFKDVDATIYKLDQGDIAMVSPMGISVYDTTGRLRGSRMIAGIDPKGYIRMTKDSVVVSTSASSQQVFNVPNRTSVPLSVVPRSNIFPNGVFIGQSPETKRFSYYNLEGKAVSGPFDAALAFSEGIAAVKLDQMQLPYLIDEKFKAIPLKDGVSSYVGPMSEGLGLFQEQGVVGFVDPTGKRKFFVRAQKASACKEGRIVIVDEKGYHVIDRNGKRIVAKDYQEVQEFSNGLARFRSGGLIGFMDTTGKEVIPATFQDASPFQPRGAIVQSGGTFHLINRKGERVGTENYTAARPGSEGTFPVQLNGRYGLIDDAGKMMIPFQYDMILGTSKGVVAARQGDEFVILTRTGQAMFKVKADQILPLSKDYFAYKAGDFYGILDAKGNIVLEPSATAISEMQNGNVLLGSRKSKYFTIKLQ